jgi:hypothetical protein
MIMSRPNPDVLYQLMPEMYRVADAAQGYPLRALLRLIGNQAETVRADIQQLWDNFFIETAESWAIPYIGDLVSNRTLHDIDLAPDASTAESLFPDLAGPDLRPISSIRTRADVANTIYYRRRKGTTAMLEQLARDVTGWGAHVVEFFEILTWNQNLNHIRPQSSGCVNLRDITTCAQVETPFDQSSHTVDVRAIAQSEGWHNVPNLGFFLFRLENFPMVKAHARSIATSSWRFTFSQLGNSAPLFSQPRASLDPGMSEELLVPESIPPTSFYDDLTAWADSSAAQQDFSLYYGDATDDPNWSITVYEQAAAGAALVPVNVAEVECSNLRLWTTMTQPNDNFIHIDVVRGRLVIGSQRPASTAIYVSYNYGFSAHLGGGPYDDRQKWVVPDANAPQVIKVKAGVATLQQAITQWTTNPAQNTIIDVADSDTYSISSPITLRAGTWLVIQAAPGCRPHFQPQGANATLNISADPPATATTPPTCGLTLSGLLIEGGVEVDGDLAQLRILHCTLVPNRSIAEEVAAPPTGPSIVVQPADGSGNQINTFLQVQIAYSILGPLVIPETIDALYLLDSIVDGQSATNAIANAAGKNGPRATIERSTILGPTFFRKFDLCSDSIFTGLITVQQRVSGCLRFSFVPFGSFVPQQYRCQPAMEIANEIAQAKAQALAAGRTFSNAQATTIQNSVLSWLIPSFQSNVYGQPEYCQLQLVTPLQIRAGASDGAEMGVLNQLKQPQRETNLRIRLEEYVPFGRSSGIIYVT